MTIKGQHKLQLLWLLRLLFKVNQQIATIIPGLRQKCEIARLILHLKMSINHLISWTPASCTVPIILLDAAKLGIGLIFSVYNWDQSKLVCKGAYQRVIRYHHEIRPQIQSSLIRGHFSQKPGFTKVAVGQIWLMNNLISFWQFVPRL